MCRIPEDNQEKIDKNLQIPKHLFWPLTSAVSPRSTGHLRLPHLSLQMAKRWHSDIVTWYQFAPTQKPLIFIQCPRHIIQVSFLLSLCMPWTQGQVGLAASVWDVPPSVGGLLLWTQGQVVVAKLLSGHESLASVIGSCHDSAKGNQWWQAVSVTWTPLLPANPGRKASGDYKCKYRLQCLRCLKALRPKGSQKHASRRSNRRLHRIGSTRRAGPQRFFLEVEEDGQHCLAALCAKNCEWPSKCC